MNPSETFCWKLLYLTWFKQQFLFQYIRRFQDLIPFVQFKKREKQAVSQIFEILIFSQNITGNVHYVPEIKLIS